NLLTNTFTNSEMLASMNGLKPGDPLLTPESLALMIPADQHERLGAAIQRCAQDGTSYTIDVEHKRPEGGSFPARIRGQAFRDSDGNITMLHGTLQDLSELVEADQRLQTLADNLPNGAIFRCEQTQEGKLFLRYVSAGIQQLVGASADTFLGDQRAFTARLHPQDIQSFFDGVQHSLRQCSPFDLVTRVRHMDGHYRWMRARAVPRRTQHGMIWEGILLDVTAEYETQQSLRLAKEAAEAAERAKSEFLATMSHEIRTPMNTVIGMTQLLQQTPMSAKQRNYLDKVALSANALLKIINDILDFSKLEAEMLHIDPVDFQLDELLESVATVTGLRAEQKGVEIVYNIAPNVPRHLHGDVQRLGQILTNLVSNAVKFTERGEVVISMRAEPASTAPASRDCMLHVSVRDTGIGIHPEHMALLFQPFTQAEAHISRRFGGTGLGLAISHKLVHLMGGDIEVDSELGRGSTFSFHVRVQAQALHVEPKNLMAPDYRVLVVDDNLMAREILSNMVSGFGLECTTASNGTDALQELHTANRIQRPYQLVLMDWQMPGMDGLTVAEHIRNDQELSTTPAMLMVTAYCRDEVAERVAQLQLQGLLIKPVTESVLFNAMQEALQSHNHKDGLHIRNVSPSDRLQTPASLAGRRILVVDDNALNREVAQDFLELANVEVTTASSGPEALRIMEQKAFDAVLLDVQMPEMDGLEVARRIRQHPQWKDLPVWALTAQARVEDRQAILDSGMHGQLTKPINAQVLYSTLAQALEQTPRCHVSGAASALRPQQASGIAQILEGQQERMQRLLRAFIRDFDASPKHMQQLFAQQDWKALGMMAHTLKGSLGYLDQPTAMQAMESLEWACKHEQATQTMTDAAAQHLRRVLQHIHQQLEAAAPSAPAASQDASALNTAQLLQWLEQAIPLVQRGDYAGMRVLEQLEAGLRGSPLHGIAARALALAEDLENAAACDCLHTLRTQLQTHATTSGHQT
ncbi:MAG: response regulator, partial [Comamonas sp.]